MKILTAIEPGTEARAPHVMNEETRAVPCV
jgi:hypothetical protein